MVDKATQICSKAWAKARSGTEAGICEWLRACLPGGAPKLHRWLKANDRVTVQFFTGFKDVVQNPKDMMEHREHFWGGWWTPDSVRRRLLEESPGELRASAQLAAMEAPDLE
eukprot:7874929-Pyramimonas_sp.AAC.1